MLNYKQFLDLSKRTDADEFNKQWFFSSKFNKRLAFLFYKFGLSANQVTGLFGILGLFCALFFYLNQVIIAYIFWRLHFIVDLADGDIARAKNQMSNFGSGFDKTNHLFVNGLVLYAISAQETNIMIILLLTHQFSFFFNLIFDIKPAEHLFKISNPYTRFLRNIINMEGLLVLYTLNSVFNFSFDNLILRAYLVLFTLMAIAKVYIMLTKGEE